MSKFLSTAQSLDDQAQNDRAYDESRILRFSGADSSVLASNPAHQFAQDHALAVYRGNAIYSFIPKNACSTMRYSISRHNGCIGNEQEFGWIHKNNATFRASLRELALADYNFVVLRCPYRRIVSLFLDKIAGFGEDNRLPALACRGWRKFMPVRHCVDRITFRRFLQLLCAPGALSIDHHWTPQVRFLVYKDYDDVFRVEALREAKRRLAERIGLHLHDARELTCHGTQALCPVSTIKAADLPTAEIRLMRKNGYVPKYRDFFDAETQAMANGLYKEDIELLVSHFGEDALLL